MYLISSVETSDVAARVVTDRHTNRHVRTHTQDKYRNPPAHARRGLTRYRSSRPGIYTTRFGSRSPITVSRLERKAASTKCLLRINKVCTVGYVSFASLRTVYIRLSLCASDPHITPPSTDAPVASGPQQKLYGECIFFHTG